MRAAPGICLTTVRERPVVSRFCVFALSMVWRRPGSITSGAALGRRLHTHFWPLIRGEISDFSTLFHAQMAYDNGF
jgi:hypothetical protein